MSEISARRGTVGRVRPRGTAVRLSEEVEMRARVLIVLGLLVASGCAGSDGADPAASSTTTFAVAGAEATTTSDPTPVAPSDPSTSPESSTSAATTFTTTAATTTITTSTTSTASTTQPPAATSPPPSQPPPCAGEPEILLPPDAVVGSMVAGDLDGDGAVDQVQVYSQGDTWGVHLVLAHGWETDRTLQDLIAPDSPVVEAVAVLDLGEPAALLQLGGSLIGTRFGFVVLEECALTPASGPSGAVQDFVVGGGLHHQWQFTCEPGLVTQVRVNLTGGVAGDEPAIVDIWEYGYDLATSTFAAPVESGRDVAGRDLGDVLADYPACVPG